MTRHQKKPEEMYSPIATEVHVAGGLHCKQRPDETLQESLQNFTDLAEKQWELTLLTLLFNYIFVYQNLYNNDIR